ncbi:hypothetical protein P8452_72084 [Trifolium repens]|nr:hypothetical protein P8452_72084 [Trifolium repens]
MNLAATSFSASLKSSPANTTSERERETEPIHTFRNGHYIDSWLLHTKILTYPFPPNTHSHTTDTHITLFSSSFRFLFFRFIHFKLSLWEIKVYLLGQVSKL